MPQFAVYFIPQADTDFYKLGSAVLGYDIRAGKNTKMPQQLKYEIEGFKPSWVTRAKPYGFHLTIGDAIHFTQKKILAKAEAELAQILSWFSPRNPFTLTWREEKFVTFWRYEKDIVVLRYLASSALKIFHTLVTSRINILGESSGYMDHYEKFPEEYTPHRSERIKTFYTPTIFDSYSPHFTLLNPYNGDSHKQLQKRLSRRFGQYPHILLRSVCLMVQWEATENWQIHREFKLDPFTNRWKKV